ncbi:uncharacterized protein LOC142633284 [Castanea sativa]|uniref:uncharacterized protein LOC142633284 n=1 Tax=Castanea sativa TaxID=21020 RepID=UPI003F64DFA1
MVEEKRTTLMVIKVDLECSRCYKKIKKVLCKIPQVQDQVYNEKENLVVIKVVCCSAEKIKRKIIYKGGDTIKNIEIREIEKSKPTKENEIENPKLDSKPLLGPVGFGTCCCTECVQGRSEGPCHCGQCRPPGCDCGCHGKPVCDSSSRGCKRSCNVNQNQFDHFSLEPSPLCTIM